MEWRDVDAEILAPTFLGEVPGSEVLSHLVHGGGTTGKLVVVVGLTKETLGKGLLGSQGPSFRRG